MTVLGDWDAELDPGGWWGLSHGSNWEGAKKGKKKKREKDGGTFRVPGELLFHTREEAEARLREALREGDNGYNVEDGDDGGDEGDEGGDKGEGRDKGGEVGGDKGGEKEWDMGGGEGECREQGCAPATPPPRRRGNLRAATREWGPWGQGG